MSILKDSQYENTVKWVWLSLTIGEGAKNSSDVIDYFCCEPERIYEIEDYSEISGKNKLFTCHQSEKLHNKDLSLAKKIVDYCENNQVQIITPSKKEYPRILLNTQSCPLVLYCLGTMPDLEGRISISCVGTRKMTRTGRRSGYEIAYDLAKSGIVITSGLALGIDSICHRAALDASGTTLAVLGCGIDHIYPSQNASLMKEIIRLGGAIISEFAPGTPPVAHNFPVRNRIVSALSVGTLVIEAGERSGSLNTARHALQQGRDLFSVPGETGEFSHMGTNLLLKNGAIPVTEAEDIIKFYTERYGSKINFNQTFRRNALKKASSPDLTHSGALVRRFSSKSAESDEQGGKSKDTDKRRDSSESCADKDFSGLGFASKQIAQLIYSEPMFPDEIAQKLSMRIHEVITELSFLELDGIVRVTAGGKYTSG